jgi:hypothetical protein
MQQSLEDRELALPVLQAGECRKVVRRERFGLSIIGDAWR